VVDPADAVVRRRRSYDEFDAMPWRLHRAGHAARLLASRSRATDDHFRRDFASRTSQLRRIEMRMNRILN
jgi:hypothetical protein